MSFLLTGNAPTEFPSPVRPAMGIVAAEVLLVFAVFFIEGAWPVPDVNEPYYLGKAIHFWRPEWIRGDFFLNSSDTHKAFYFTLGWPALWLQPWTLAWSGRLLTWALLAWAWRRLSWAVLPRPWFCVLTAALFACLLARCHMAGEWVIGGVEAKGFAYVLVLVGAEALVRNRWNLGFVLFGGAALFHVLVGGWSAVAGGLAWALGGSDRTKTGALAFPWLPRFFDHSREPAPVLSGPVRVKRRPPLRALWPGLLAGLVLSLPGLIPSLRLTWGIDPQTVERANFIYVYERLAHHLVLGAFPPLFLLRFGLLLALWLLLCRATPGNGPTGRLQGFVTGAIAIAVAGLAINAAAVFAPAKAAGLLRFYWFRLSDVAVPLGVVLLGTWWIAEQLRLRPATGKPLLAGIVTVAALHVGDLAVRRPFPTVPRTVRLQNYAAWRNVCDWIAQSSEIPRDARFLTPRMNQTFKWYAGRAEVANWKEIPQDARSIVAWWDRLVELHGTGSGLPAYRWRESLTELSPKELQRLGGKYGADYVLTEATPPLQLPLLYRNRRYAVYRLETAGVSTNNRSKAPTF